jgi:hypothetical protein
VTRMRDEKVLGLRQERSAGHATTATGWVLPVAVDLLVPVRATPSVLCAVMIPAADSIAFRSAAATLQRTSFTE